MELSFKQEMIVAILTTAIVLAIFYGLWIFGKRTLWVCLILFIGYLIHALRPTPVGEGYPWYKDGGKR